jgi:hypothetical protein
LTDADAPPDEEEHDDVHPEPEGDGDPLLARASAILRYLHSSGWLRIETQSDYTIAYTLPAHASPLPIVSPACSRKRIAWR